MLLDMVIKLLALGTKNVSARGRTGGTGHVNLGPLISLKVLELES